LATDREPLKKLSTRLRLRAPLPAWLTRVLPRSTGWWVVLATLGFIGVTVWWLTQDNRVPDFDEGHHLLFAYEVHQQLATGDLAGPFTNFNNYPPLVHIVGALAVFIAGMHESAVILSDNIVFLPLLVGGCYGVATIAFGRRAGLLAALFALGTPMIVSEMREYYVDPGEAAMVAISAWAILASRRFERVWMSLLAGVLCGIGMLSKETFPLFLVGLILVVLLRGGWRNWRGLLAFVAAGAALGLPWYIDHYTALNGLTSGATSVPTATGPANATGVYPPRISGTNAAWYLWSMLNHQLLAPLTLLFATGTGLAAWRFARRRDSQDLAPELIIGGLVGYLGVTYINLKDPRYSLPALVYMAVLATGWIATARPRLRTWLTAVFGLIVAANFVAVSFGVGPTVALTLPGAPAASVAGAREITFFSPQGWLRSGPVRDGDMLGLLIGLGRVGVQQVEIDGGSANIPDFNQSGFDALAEEAAMPAPPYSFSGLGPRDAYVLRHYIVPGDPPPCQRLDDGSGVYVVLGNPQRAVFQELTFICPGRKPLSYRRTAPLPESITHNITGPVRGQLLTMMLAMRRQGITTVEFDLSNMYTDYIDPLGLDRLATAAGLSIPPAYQPATLGPRQAFMFRHVPLKGDPPPCLRLSDGSGVYMIFGTPYLQFNDYTFYCPTRTPHIYRHG
jgi:4-amino-4-deoxy-L-arabinose transferase-like glycosyltransferase